MVEAPASSGCTLLLRFASMALEGFAGFLRVADANLTETFQACAMFGQSSLGSEQHMQV